MEGKCDKSSYVMTSAVITEGMAFHVEERQAENASKPTL